MEFTKNPMNNGIVSQATAWGFPCDLDEEGKWHILPRFKTGRWELQGWDDRWILLVKGVPQISFHPKEALAFMERRWSARQARFPKASRRTKMKA